MLLTCKEAKLYRDTELFGKMSPHCVIYYDNLEYKTVVHKKGGKFPKWEDQFKLEVQSMSDEIKFSVIVEHSMNKHIVGTGFIKLITLCMF